MLFAGAIHTGIGMGVVFAVMYILSKLYELFGVLFARNAGMPAPAAAMPAAAKSVQPLGAGPAQAAPARATQAQAAQEQVQAAPEELIAVIAAAFAAATVAGKDQAPVPRPILPYRTSAAWPTAAKTENTGRRF